MFVPGLSLALRRTVHLTQGFTRFCVTHNVWKSDRYRTFSQRPDELDSDGVKKKPRPKTISIPKITLISPDNSVTVTVLEEAQRLAKRRNLNLIKVSDLDSKTHRPIYKLLNNFDILESVKNDEIVTNVDKIEQKLNKTPKLFYVASKITDHDLQIKTKNMVRLLNKGYKVKIVITLDGTDGNKVQKCIEDGVRNRGSIQKMPSKKNSILLLINPILKNEDLSPENESTTGS